ncbi:MAG: hypothetical protein QF721_06220 [Verrucomicrobiota bacterium]|jgi:hypothetical protein|nr:hypothetical protein [Verrucomicrobiota bacterium]
MSQHKPSRRERSEQTAQQARNAPAQPTSRDISAQSTLEERRHYRLGWWSLFLFVCLGILLEGLLAFRVGWYLDVGDNETHRLMLRLGHAHGTLLSVLNIAFAASLPRLGMPAGARVLASRCLAAATLLVPGGFILGGLITHGADPGLGIILLPAGAVLLLVGIFAVARHTGK